MKPEPNASTEENLSPMEIKVEKIEKETSIFSRIFDKSTNWKFSILVVCLICAIENLLITGSASVVLSTIEKEFFLTSTQSGFFLGIFEAAGFIAGPLFGFFASFRTFNKIKIISFSSFLLFIGAYMIGLTIFLKEPYLDFLNNQIDDNSSTTCTFEESRSTLTSMFGSKSSDNSDLTCDEDDKRRQFLQDLSSTYDYSNHLEILLYIGHFIIGCGAVVIFSNGVVYIEEISPKESSSYCLATFYVVGSIGGGIGYLATGQFLTINARFYMNSNYEPNEWITPNHPYWIGAWWLPYLIYGSLCAILFFCVFIFSYRSYDITTAQPSTIVVVVNEIEPNNYTKKKSKISKYLSVLGKVISSFGSKFLEVMKNVQFIFIILSNVTEGIIIKGFLGFLAKYIEYQFQMPANQATVLLGGIGFIGVMLGTLLGAYIINRYKLDCKDCAFLTTLIFFVSSFLFLILLNSCQEISFIEMSNSTKCANCDCTNQFNPICFDKTVLSPNFTVNAYQSACHAGCHVQLDGDDSFTKCLCLNNTLLAASSSSDLVLASKNCDRSVKCLDKLLINALASFFIVLFSSLSLIPHLKATFGTISDPSVHSFGLGVRSAIVNLFGNCFGLILIGKLVDDSCIYWQRNCFGNKVCKLYDNRAMSLSLVSVGFASRMLSAIFMIFVCIIYHRNFQNSKAKKNHVEHEIEMTGQITKF